MLYNDCNQCPIQPVWLPSMWMTIKTISSASRKKAVIDLSQILPPNFFIAEIERSCHKLSYDIFTILNFDVILKLFDDKKGR